MNHAKKTTISALISATVFMQASGAAPPTDAMAFDQTHLKKQIDSLKVDGHYWHKISWKKSVSEGLAESIRTHKPVFLWAFIDLPDTERC